jgi:hypothetical protein
MRFRPHQRTTKEISSQSLREDGGVNSSSWYERDMNSPHLSVASTQSAYKSSIALDLDHHEVSFTRTSLVASDIRTPFSSTTRLSFHSEASG